jgi:hypothetical protein
LAHFAGGAGAVAILSALEDADAASIMASADATGRTKREKVIRANPFLERFTVADLKSRADRKIRVPVHRSHQNPAIRGYLVSVLVWRAYSAQRNRTRRTSCATHFAEHEKL